MGEIAANLNFEYQSQPLELIRRVKNVLETELRVIAEAQVDVVSVSEENNPRYRDEEIINESLQRLIIQTRESDAKLRGLQSEQENFVIRYQESVRVNQEYEKVAKQVPHNQALVDQAQRNKEAYDLDLKNQAGEILHKRQELMDRHQRTFVTLQELMAKVLQIKLVEVIHLKNNFINIQLLIKVEKATGIAIQWASSVWQSVEKDPRGILVVVVFSLRC